MAQDDREALAIDAAAAWFAKLRAPVVDAATLQAFYAWRADPAHDAAYGRIEALWRQGEGLQDDPQIRAAVHDALARGEGLARPLGEVGRRAAVAAAAGVLILAAAGAGIWLTRPPSYETAVGEQRQVALADGSKVLLDTDSRIVARLDAETRQVALTRGRAMFFVAGDPARPFVVSAGSAAIEATGTQFDVGRRADQVQVVLVEGAVEVRDRAAGAAWRLRPGEQITTGADRAPTRTDARAAVSWTRGELVFHDRPLAQALDDANRYSRRKIRLTSRRDIAAAEVNGVFRTGDVDALAEAVAHLYALDLSRGPNGDLLLRDRSG